MNQIIKNDINYFFKLENDIKIINNKLSIVNQFHKIVKFNYNTNVFWYINYDFYIKNKIFPNVKINTLLFSDLSNINYICKQKSDLELIFRQKKIKINTLKNKIINNINLESYNKYKTNIHFPKPKNALNKPEIDIRNILFDIQKNKKEIILIYPQYRLPVKFKSYLFADFYLLFLINDTIFPLIIEFDGPKHTSNHFIYFSKDSIKCDIIKNNFSLLNSISIIRINHVDDITIKIKDCIDYITLNNTNYTCIPTYESYIELLK